MKLIELSLRISTDIVNRSYEGVKWVWFYLSPLNKFQINFHNKQYWYFIPVRKFTEIKSRCVSITNCTSFGERINSRGIRAYPGLILEEVSKKSVIFMEGGGQNLIFWQKIATFSKITFFWKKLSTRLERNLPLEYHAEGPNNASLHNRRCWIINYSIIIGCSSI